MAHDFTTSTVSTLLESEGCPSDNDSRVVNYTRALSTTRSIRLRSWYSQGQVQPPVLVSTITVGLTRTLTRGSVGRARIGEAGQPSSSTPSPHVVREGKGGVGGS